MARVFGWEQALALDERENYIRLVAVDKAATLWIHLAALLILFVVTLRGYGLIDLGGEAQGFAKGLGASMIFYADT